jgi:hypothetical protein
MSEKFIDLNPKEIKRDFFRIELSADGWYSGYVEIQDESLLLDNRSYFSFPIKLNPRVGIISDLNSLPPTLMSMLEIYAGGKQNIYRIDDNATNLADFEKYDFLLVYAKENLNFKLQTLLERYNNSGKGVLFCMSQNDSDLMKEYYLSRFGITPLEFETENTAISYSNQFHEIVALSKNKGINELSVRDFQKIKTTTGITPILSASGSPLILNPDPNWIFMFDIASLRNSLFLDSNWPVLSYRIFLSLSNIDRNKFTFQAGTALRADKIVLPDRSEIIPVSGTYTPQQPGIYGLKQKDNHSNVAINPDLRESDYQAAEFDSIKNSDTISEDWTKQVFRARYGFELWKILLVTVLFLFIIEMLLVKTAEHKKD